MNLQELLHYFPEAKRVGSNYMVRCPAHDDSTPSLGIRESDDGKKILLGCFAQCSAQHITQAVGLKVSDLYLDDTNKRGPALKLTPPKAQPKANFPSPFELKDVWEKATRVDEYGESRGWLFHARKIDPVLVAELDLARVRKTPGLYPWCKSFGGYPYCVLLPVYLASGEFVSLRARSIDPKEKNKELAAKGTAKGTFFANGPTLKMLREGVQVEELWIVEGGTDFLVASTLAPTVAVLGIHSASHSSELYEVLKQRVKKVVLATDLDPAGDKYALQWARPLADKEVYRWKGVEGGTATDINDALKESGSEALLASLAKATLFKDRTDASKEARPKIRVTCQIDEVADQAEQAIANDPQVYQRAGGLVIVTKMREPEVHAMTPAMLRERLCGCAVWSKFDERSNKDKPTTPPDHVINALLDRKEWPNVRELRGIYTHPYLKPGGTLATQNGYDEETKSLLLSDLSLSVPDKPTQQDAILAAKELLEVVRDFDFITESARSAWLALVLSLVARPAIDGSVPLFSFDASTIGSGKTLLVETASLIVRGHSPHVVSAPESPDEWRKLIVTLLLGGESLLLIDNIREGRELGNPTLEAVLTTSNYQDRALGKNALLKLPSTAIWTATGNNLSMSADLARRALPCRLEPKVEDPEKRDDFAYPKLKQWVKAERPRLLRAALVMLRAWCVAGRPCVGSTWGSFEAWNDMIPAVLRWCGLTDPSQAHQDLTKDDPHKTALRGFLFAFRAAFANGEVVTANQILKHTNQPDGESLKNAMESLAPRNGKPHSAPSLSAALRKHKGRIVNGFSLASCLDPHSEVVSWFVKQITKTEENASKPAEHTSRGAEQSPSKEEFAGVAGVYPPIFQSSPKIQKTTMYESKAGNGDTLAEVQETTPATPATPANRVPPQRLQPLADEEKESENVSGNSSFARKPSQDKAEKEENVSVSGKNGVLNGVNPAKVLAES